MGVVMEFGQISWTEWVESGRWLHARDPELPVSSELTDQALALAADPEVSVHQIVRLVSKEQVLATRVLRLANSASHAPVRPITTITDATVRVGTEAVRHTLLAACVASRMESQTIHARGGRQLLDHSIGTAYMAEFVASSVGADPHEALVGGLLHDIGKLAILKLSVEAPGYRGPAPTARQIERLIDERHPLVGAQLLRAWRLPDSLREPVLYHHRPDLALLCTEQTTIVYVANLLSHRYGFGCAADPDLDVLADPWVAELGLGDAWLAGIDARAHERFAAARALVA
jgi:putative nucleotidyltransferase with HDIG domain